MIKVGIPKPEVRGKGQAQNPPLDLNAIRIRAEAQTDKQTRADLFALIAEVKRLTRNG